MAGWCADAATRFTVDVSGRETSATPLWASIELVMAVAIIAAGLNLPLTIFALGSAPWLMAIGALCVWWRGPGVRAIVRGTPVPISRGVALGLVIGVAYQFVGTYAAEPVIARLTSGALPD